MTIDGPSQILVVEDDRDIREGLIQLLSLEGYAVSAVANGEEALDALRGAPSLPDVILLDMMMPVLDGFQFREEQLRDRSLESIPVVVLSAGAAFSDIKDRVKAHAYLRKPFQIDDVLETVARLCRA